VAKKLKAKGANLLIEHGAGDAASFPDSSFKDTEVAADARGALARADVLLTVQPPSLDEIAALKEGAVTIGYLQPHLAPERIKALRDRRITSFAMELLPRTTRAQAMDVLSSQANIAGYKAVLIAAEASPKFFPMLTTAAGTVRPSKVLIVGAGVAGLQAIATARRLGAIVTATDVRPAAKEQVESLGAKFIAVEDEEFKQAETAAGYAKEMSKAYQEKQAALVAEHVKKQDIVITTALIPGRPAPRLISAAMVQSMRPGSVIVDLAVERGGNVEGVKPDQVTDVNGVKIVGYRNVPGRLAASASSLYARNLFNFVELLIDKKTKALAVNWDDEIVKATALTRDGAVIHPNFQPKTAG
jgi:NAD(P) transhydrogenase subunit alpha